VCVCVCVGETYKRTCHDRLCVCVRRFRVVVRCVAAFLVVQVTSESQLRLQPTGELELSAKAQQVRSSDAVFVLSLCCVPFL